MLPIELFCQENPEVASKFQVNYNPKTFEAKVMVETPDPDKFNYLYHRFCLQEEFLELNTIPVAKIEGVEQNARTISRNSNKRKLIAV